MTRSLLLVALLAAPAPAQLRVVTYNTSDGNLGSTTNPFAVGTTRRSAVTTVLQAIGTESVGGIARPLDVLLIQESRGAASSGQTFVDILNGIYGAGTYARGTVDGTSDGAGTHTFVYRAATVDLVGELAFGTIGGTGPVRQPVRHHIRPDGYSAADLYLYNAHWSAGDATRRANEATLTRQNAAGIGTDVRAIYAGDFNLQGPSEGGYVNLTTGPARAIDPVFSGTTWTTNTLANRRLHSQSPVTTSLYPGQATGGMDDRLDFLLPTANMDPTSGRGIRQVPGTYRVFGNDGSHAFNGELTSGSQPAAVLTALRQTSEHLPVVADYTLPARLGGTVTVVNPRVIRGQTAAVTLGVTNSAPVAVAAGADVLDYTYGRTGDVTGGGTNAGLAALAPAAVHTFQVPTTTARDYAGTVTATATSPQAAAEFSSAAVSVTALDPSNGSLSNAGLVTTQSVTFGPVAVGQTPTRAVAVYNLVGPNGAAWTADLRYLGLDERFAGGPLTATLAPTSPDLAPGSGNWTLTVIASSAATGNFTDTFTIRLSDEDILGATNQSLTVTVSAEFVPVPEPAGMLIVALVVACRRKPWRVGSDAAT
jgi:hypothetical protein